MKPRSCSCSCVCADENLSHYTTPSPEASQETGQPAICSRLFLQEVVKLLKSCRWPIGVRDQHPTPVASGSTSLKMLHVLQEGTLVVHKNRCPHAADLFGLRCGTARERWPVASRIRVELPVDHMDEPERSRRGWCRGERTNAQIEWLVPRRKNKCPDRSPMTELVGASAAPSRARKIHHPEAQKATSCASQEQ